MDREFQQCGGESWAAGVSGNENGEGAEQAAGASEERRIHEINLLNSQLLALAFSLSEFTGNSPWVGTPHPGATDIEIANTYLKNAYQKSLGKCK